MPPKAYIATVNMGYGHERAAYALQNLADKATYLAADDYPGIPSSDRHVWVQTRKFYERISRLQPLPVIGKALFEVLIDSLQHIDRFYPRRDLSSPNIQLKYIYHLIKKRNLGLDFIERLRKRPLPLVSTFFAVAFAADVFDYPEEIYCVICDADISRVWAPEDPKRSRIKYFASNGRVAERLKLYGVREENIFLTGFPLPKELIGGAKGSTLKRNLLRRICNLDPQGLFWKKYHKTLRNVLGSSCINHPPGPVVLTFTVGGAGAQKKLGLEIIKSLREKIRRKKIHINLVAGTRRDAANYFKQGIKKLGLKKELGSAIQIFYMPSRIEYFRHFSEVLEQTDVLWTKPSELSFYTGLGIPIIMAPAIGSQEDFNRVWLQQVGGGIDQEDPRYTKEWLFDWINSGGLARMAWNGFVEAPTRGAFRIESIITGKPLDLQPPPLVV